MSYVLPEGEAPPLCRWCGKAIKKRTGSAHFGRRALTHSSDHAWFRTFEAKPTSLAEAQRIVGNEKIVSVRWSRPEDEAAWIDKAGFWDGQTYEDPFFCNGDHAQRFGYAAARKGLAMPDYNSAIINRNAAKKGQS